MKKFLMVGALVVSAVLLSQQRAAAWSKWNFSVGLNISYEGANNSYLWGLKTSGQVPGYPTDVYHGYGLFYPGAPAPVPVPAYGYDYPGAAPYGDAPYGYAPPANDPTFQPPAPKEVPDKDKKKDEGSLSWYGNPNYQPAVYYYQTPSYTAPAVNNAPAANYYQPSPNYYPQYGYQQGYGYSYGGQQVPSYWYGR